MNKSELIEALAPRLGGRTHAAAAVEAMVDVVLREVAAGRSVGITGFGTFERVERAPRTGRNPRTGEAVPIAGTSSPRFRPGTYFKDVVADPSALPAQGLAGARVSSEGSLKHTGAPSSVRRNAGSAGAAGAGTEDGPTERPRRGTTRPVTGTPESVRKDADADASDGGRSALRESETSMLPAGRMMPGGEDITLGMISAKKAQLARVKNDELAAKQRKKDKGDVKGKKRKKNQKNTKGKGGKNKTS